MPVWQENFHHIGDDLGHKLVRDGPRDFIIYASGRLHCQKVYGFINLYPRHDMISQIFDMASAAPARDRVHINVFLNEDEIDPVVFAILPRSKVASISKQRWDINNFPKAKEFPLFPKEVVNII